MKKFLVFLMLVAMASFLFVGCLPSVTPAVEEEEEVVAEEEEEEEVVEAAQTDAPYITAVAGINILSSSTQYIDADETLTVTGVGIAGAIIKLYIDDVYAGVGSTGSGGAFTTIGITGITLAEGVRVVHVTATLPGLAESDASTAYTFTYDKTAPTIASVAGDSSSNYITVTFSEAVANATGGTWLYRSQTTASITTPVHVPAAITAPSATTVRLTEMANAADATRDLEVGDYLYVRATGGTTADLAGNILVVPITVEGTVVP